ncbi:hypothetical protein D3C87_600930 [compost metagenome]
MGEAISFTAKPVIYYDDEASELLGGDYYRVAESFRYYLGEKYAEQWVYIPAGMLTDLASIPRIVWNILPPTGKYGAAAIVHDRLCNTLQITVEGKLQSISRERADGILGEAMEVLQVPWLKRVTISSAVALHRIFRRIKDPVISELQLKLERDWVKAIPPVYDY